MARIRSIKVDLFVDDSLADVSVEAHLLLAGLPCIADSAGRLEDRPKRIHALLMPYRPSFDVSARLNELQGAGALIRYEVSGVRYIQVTNWDRDQRPHVKEADSLIPPPPHNYTEHRLGSEVAGKSPGSRPYEPAGIRDSGCGVLDLGCGDLPPSAPASAAPEQGSLLPTHDSDPDSSTPTAQSQIPHPNRRKGPAKPRKGPGCGQTTDPRHAPLVRALTDSGWPFDGPKDAAQVKALLALADQQETTRGEGAGNEVLRRARIAWDQFPDYHSARTLTQLRSKWGEFAAPLSNGGAGTRQQEIWEGLQEGRREALEAAGRTYSPELATADYINTTLARWKDTRKGDGSEELTVLSASFGYYCEDPRYLEKGLPVKLFLSPSVFAECEAKDRKNVAYIADLRAPGIR